MNIEERNKIERALMIVDGISSLLEEIRVADMTESIENLLVMNLAEVENLLSSVVDR